MIQSSRIVSAASAKPGSLSIVAPSVKPYAYAAPRQISFATACVRPRNQESAGSSRRAPSACTVRTLFACRSSGCTSYDARNVLGLDQCAGMTTPSISSRLMRDPGRPARNRLRSFRSGVCCRLTFPVPQTSRASIQSCRSLQFRDVLPDSEPEACLRSFETY